MAKIIHAPEIDRPGLTWLNVSQPLSLATLAGKLVILDFWTFCCINCMHVIPILRRVEDAYPDDVVVIGVHSPKFTAERDVANVVPAIARYGITHPVIHDPDFILWKQFGVRAWPTLTFISPDGYVIGQVSGEPDPRKLLEVVAQTLAENRAAGSLRPSPLVLNEVQPEESGRLRFPGKIKPLAAPRHGAVWAVADSGHHQIVLLDAEGNETRRFGSGRAGLVDGDGVAAQFHAPQGLDSDATALYVADTGNHALRRIDLGDGSVTTLAGTGRRGRPLGAARDAGETALASPWDIAVHDGHLFFANAGTHQLGQLDLARGSVAALAGSGREAIGDGAALDASLAQPSGLALAADGRILYFVDSETSAVRRLDLARGMVRTLVGRGLFDYGHVDGAFPDARLQHPLGLALTDDDTLVVADSYNNALRRLDLRRETVTDLDDGLLCRDALCLPLAEPAGIAADGRGRLLVSDTNNHRIVLYDLTTRSTRTWFR